MRTESVDDQNGDKGQELLEGEDVLILEALILAHASLATVKRLIPACRQWSRKKSDLELRKRAVYLGVTKFSKSRPETSISVGSFLSKRTQALEISLFLSLYDSTSPVDDDPQRISARRVVTAYTLYSEGRREPLDINWCVDALEWRGKNSMHLHRCPSCGSVHARKTEDDSCPICFRIPKNIVFRPEMLLRKALEMDQARQMENTQERVQHGRSPAA